MTMELLYKASNILCDSLQAASKEETQMLKMVLVGLTTALVTISTLSYDRMGGPKPRGKGSYDRMGGPEGGGSYDKMGGPKPRGKGCTNWEPLLMATAAGILAAVYTSYFQ